MWPELSAFARKELKTYCDEYINIDHRAYTEWCARELLRSLEKVDDIDDEDITISTFLSYYEHPTNKEWTEMSEEQWTELSSAYPSSFFHEEEQRTESLAADLDESFTSLPGWNSSELARSRRAMLEDSDSDQETPQARSISPPIIARADRLASLDQPRRASSAPRLASNPLPEQPDEHTSPLSVEPSKMLVPYQTARANDAPVANNASSPIETRQSLLAGGPEHIESQAPLANPADTTLVDDEFSVDITMLDAAALLDLGSLDYELLPEAAAAYPLLFSSVESVSSRVPTTYARLSSLDDPLPNVRDSVMREVPGVGGGEAMGIDPDSSAAAASKPFVPTSYDPPSGPLPSFANIDVSPLPITAGVDLPPRTPSPDPPSSSHQKAVSEKRTKAKKPVALSELPITLATFQVPDVYNALDRQLDRNRFETPAAITDASLASHTRPFIHPEDARITQVARRRLRNFLEIMPASCKELDVHDPDSRKTIVVASTRRQKDSMVAINHWVDGCALQPGREEDETAADGLIEREGGLFGLLMDPVRLRRAIDSAAESEPILALALARLSLDGRAVPSFFC